MQWQEKEEEEESMATAVPSNAGPWGRRLVGIRAPEMPLVSGSPSFLGFCSSWPAWCLVTGVITGLLHSSLWLSPLTQFRKKAYLVQKGGRSWESIFLCSCIPRCTATSSLFAILPAQSGDLFFSLHNSVILGYVLAVIWAWLLSGCKLLRAGTGLIHLGFCSVWHKVDTR